jgi:integrase
VIIGALMKDVGEDGYLFPSEGGEVHLTNSAIARAISRNLKYFGIPKFTPHDLRRTGSTQLAGFKVPRFDRDRVLNHTDQTVGSVYDVYEYQDEKRAVLNLWSDVIKRSAASRGPVNVRQLRSSLKYPKYFAG